MVSDNNKIASQITKEKRIIELLAKLLSDIKFGSLEITLHDGKIVQIEKRLKIRVDTSNNY